MTQVHRLHLTDVTPAPHLPWARPTFPVFAHLVLHPTGPILIDTGVGVGHAFIEELYSPVHHDLDEALARHGVAVGDVTTIITSHLHFDHCGQNHRFRGARVIVQQSEAEAAKAPHYTVPEWAFPTGIDLIAIDGDQEIAVGVRAISTPGHTPGHQSVLIDGAVEGRTIICCQASWNVNSFGSATTDGTRPPALPPSRNCTLSTRTACCSATTRRSGVAPGDRLTLRRRLTPKCRNVSVAMSPPAGVWCY